MNEERDAGGLERARQAHRGDDKVELTLYVAGMSARSADAIRDLQRLCEAFDDERGLAVEVVDIYEDPDAAARAQIFAVPSLVRDMPQPRRILIGTLADTANVMRLLRLSTSHPRGVQ